MTHIPRRPDFDIVCIGGGLGGAGLAVRMAGRGARVLVVERTARFQDRVRGEATHPWGTQEARDLGLYELMLRATVMEVVRTDECLAPGPARPRDNVATTPFALPRLTFSHPELQEMLLAAAQAAGAEVLREAAVTAIEPGAAGRLPVVRYERGGGAKTVSARLVAAADGRASCARGWAELNGAVHRDPPCLMMAGTLLEGTRIEPGVSYAMIHPARGRKAILLPRGDGRVRAYLAWHVKTGAPRLAGVADFRRFVDDILAIGVPAEHLEGAQQAGPLATFACNELWVEHPYRNGIALVGDAAATSDPTWGQGLALTMRDVRVLAEELTKSGDWDAAGHAYAAEHDRAYGVLHAVNNWFAELLMDPSPEGEAKRRRALPRLAEEPGRIPQHQYCGPDLPAGEAERKRLFGED